MNDKTKSDQMPSRRCVSIPACSEESDAVLSAADIRWGIIIAGEVHSHNMCLGESIIKHAVETCLETQDMTVKVLTMQSPHTQQAFAAT